MYYANLMKFALKYKWDCQMTDGPTFVLFFVAIGLFHNHFYALLAYFDDSDTARLQGGVDTCCVMLANSRVRLRATPPWL